MKFRDTSEMTIEDLKKYIASLEEYSEELTELCFYSLDDIIRDEILDAGEN